MAQRLQPMLLGIAACCGRRLQPGGRAHVVQQRRGQFLGPQRLLARLPGRALAQPGVGRVPQQGRQAPQQAFGPIGRQWGGSRAG